LSRVTDDSNNEIGTVCGYQVDANNQKYAVVCLDAQYRSTGAQFLSANVTIPDLSILKTQELWVSTDTATSNCTKILDFANNNNYTSDMVTKSRANYFVINGVTYYGQAPTIVEMVKILMYQVEINALDPTPASAYKRFPTPQAWVCSTQGQQGAVPKAWLIDGVGSVSWVNMTNSGYNVATVLEIPIQ
jgi:hypothetical protein